jgi:hydroxyacylglutathione hydrolase
VKFHEWRTSGNYRVIRLLGRYSGSYLISKDDKFVLIDTGCKRQLNKLRRSLVTLGVNKDSLAALVLTHTHFDHAENAAEIREIYQTKVIVHRSEAGFLALGDSPLAKKCTFFSWCNMNVFTKLARWLIKYPSVKVDIMVDDKLDLSFLGFDAYIIHTPGHSLGSISVIVDGEIALAGSAISGFFPGLILPLFFEDKEKMITSLKRLFDTGCSIFIPAHGMDCNRLVLHKTYEKLTVP